MRFRDASGSVNVRNALISVAVIFAAASCGGGEKVTGGTTNPPGPTTVTLSGKVVAQSGGAPVASANVAFGSRTTTSSADGSYSLSISPGTGKLVVTATGYDTYQEDVTVSANFTKDIRLAPAEHFTIGTDFAAYVPSRAGTISAVLVVLGGPDTRGFVTGSFNITDSPDNATVNSQLTSLAGALFGLSSDNKLAILGTRLTGLPNSTDSDARILGAIQEAAQASGHPELTTVPVMLLSISGGGPEAAGFAMRHADRTVGVYSRVPVAPAAFDKAVLSFPAYAVIANGDQLVDNNETIRIFQGLRSAGSPSALAVEKGVIHYGFSIAQQGIALAWMNAVLQMRMPGNAAAPLRPVDLTAGWLGEPATRAIAAWSAYQGEKSGANWFPNQLTAEQWKAFSP